ncbi:MAG: hypothetical protein WCT14_13965 [Treponemataceae bacterium]
MQKFDSAWIEERLKRISALLIEAHRSGRQDTISRYAQRIAVVHSGSPKRQFMQLIQVFHPDRLAVYVKQVADHRSLGDDAGLQTLEKLLEYETFSGTITRRHRTEPSARTYEEYGFDETYSYGDDDFGFGEDTARDEEADFGDDDFEDADPFAEGTFMDAIKREFFGNLELYPTKFEIEQFEGELDLSDYDLNDLSGAEFCVNITSLNLAMNEIDNIWPLRELSRLEFLDLSSNSLENADDLGELIALKELDLSFNDIDDIAFLLKLPLLVCVSLVGNPVKDRSVLEKLRKRGVMVIL